MGVAARRVGVELKQLSKDGLPEGVASLEPVDGDKFLWRATMIGPQDSSYQGEKLELEVRVPADYPFKPPRFFFKTKLEHPNVHSSGRICISAVKEDWSPALTIVQVLAKINLMLASPGTPCCDLEPLQLQALQNALRNRLMNRLMPVSVSN